MGFSRHNKEHETGFEPATLALARRYSTTEPLVHICKTLSGEAGDGNRTHVSSLEGWCSTIELHPHALCNDRGDRIRTCGLLVPNQAL